MKVLAIVLLAICACNAARSGPYLPSGWKPEGPSFYLPGEQKTSENPLKQEIQVEAEGSDALQEYGVPKTEEILQDLTKQELPELTTEQAFVVLDFARISKTVEQQAVEETVDTTTEEEKERVEEETVQKEDLSVKNIADALANLENEITVQQVKEENNAELKSVETGIESGDETPEGFLEYGPPGFKEYGPPKKSADIVEKVDASTEVASGNNEVRRRRFSPKLKIIRNSKLYKRSH